jgi:Zn finger protein HypA/HybF involved in hydrogenase expression
MTLFVQKAINRHVLLQKVNQLTVEIGVKSDIEPKRLQLSPSAKSQ